MILYKSVVLLQFYKIILKFSYNNGMTTTIINKVTLKIL